MKMYEIYENDFVKNNPKVKEKLWALIEKHYPHLRHSLRGNIEVDAFLIDKIFKIMEDHLNEIQKS